MIDTIPYKHIFVKHYRSLKRLNYIVKHTDQILLSLIFSKLDVSTTTEWETPIHYNQVLDFTSFITAVQDKTTFLVNFESKPK